VAAIIADEFSKYSTARLSLRVACRTAEWANLRLLEDALRKLWGEENFQVYELLQLQQADVELAAASEGVNAHEFLQEVLSRLVGSFASKPVTLRFLLDLFKNNNQFPESQSRLYEVGSRLLAQEDNESRIASRLTGSLNVDKRMAIAARIAGVMMFSNRSTISIPLTGEEDEEGDIPATELSGGYEVANDGAFEVTEEHIKEVLDTGFFTLRAPSRLGWAHQTYKEYLAAQYVVNARLSAAEVMQLLTHPDDPEGKLVPQLHETAAWLAGMMPELFHSILRIDPDVLLRSDIAGVDVADKKALVDALLQLFEEERAADDWEFRARYRKLNHPGLEAQIRSVIVDSSKNFIVRRAAIDIAQECKLEALQHELLEVALNESEQLSIRVQAAHAIAIVADSETKQLLRPLARGIVEGDSRDELKGAALSVVWPDHLTAEELFENLPTPQESFFGSYYLFLSQNFAIHLTTRDLPIALEWAKRQEAPHYLQFWFERVIDEIILRAWDHLDDADILSSFADFAWQRLKNYDDIIETRQSEDLRNHLLRIDERRRTALRALFTRVQEPEKEWRLFIHSQVLRIFPRDLPWLIALLSDTDSSTVQQTLIQLTKAFFSYEVEPAYLEALSAVCESNSNLKARLGDLFYVELDTPEAVSMKANYALMTDWSKREVKQSPLLEPAPSERVETMLSRFERGDLSAWWRLNRELTLEPRSTHYGDELEWNITSLPGWSAADPQTRMRIVAAAKQYVIEGDPEAPEWFGTNLIHFPAFAGYRALLLLLLQEQEWLVSLSKDCWQKWTPIIVAYPTSTGNAEEDSPHSKLIATAYTHAPSTVISNLLMLLETANSKDEYFSLSEKFNGCWDERFQQALLEKAKDKNLKTRYLSQILDELLSRSIDLANALAESLITSPIPPEGDDRERAIVAARALMAHSPTAGWSVVWPAMQRDVAFGREVSESLEYILRAGRSSLFARLSDTELADYFIWLSIQYPHKEDPSYEGMHFVGPRETLARWRDSILQQLKERGTNSSAAAVERIVNALPEVEWLKWVLIDARKITRQRTWAPLSASSVIRLGQMRFGLVERDGKAALTIGIGLEKIVTPITSGQFSESSMEYPHLRDLLETYADQSRQLVFFTGAGLSVPLFPRWRDLLEEFVNECDGQGKLNYDKSELLAMVSRGDGYLDVADACARGIGESGYREFIAKRFGLEFSYDDVPSAYKELFGLDVRTLITTNYDRIPDIAGRGEYVCYSNRRVAEAFESLGRRQKLVMKMHGEINDHDSIVLTSQDYTNIIYGNEPLKKFLESIFLRDTVLFLGFSFTDPHIDALLKAIHNITSGMIRHYVLIGDATPFQIDALESKYAVKVIPYNSSSNDHPEVLQFFACCAKPEIEE